MSRAEPAVVLWVRRLCIAALGVHLVLASWSMYRRIWQVLRIDVAASSTAVGPGTTASYDVITGGETPNRIRLELVQGTHAETIYEERTGVIQYSGWNPRVFRYQRTVPVTPELLSRFARGPAILRLTGFGGQKLLRIPPPRVRELVVTLLF